ncbi:hypothetical protein NQ314_001623 [Rhamnusium bicolor]|uniref:Uncharacterized protein n=1 Tax=Rhamnusium bicolor TaxID=1586634 RepID=A0AAV8ZRH6_9CUCU|nr:hypothetical protein NQ314_001623 [Rhamnusium bicolor]
MQYFFQAVSQNGIYVCTGTERRQEAKINGLFYLVLPEYGVLASEKLPKTTLNADPAALLSYKSYAAEGICFTPVVPMKLWKISFKGKMRDHSHKRDWSLMHRYIYHMFYLSNRTKISVGVVCQPCTSSCLEMGFITHPDGKLEAIESCDLLLYQHGENGVLNNELCFTFEANSITYDVKIKYVHDVVHYVGNDTEAKMNERFLTCEVNGILGRGISEWHYNNINK